MSAQHTQGPWTANKEAGEWYVDARADKSNPHTVAICPPTSNETEADARLIACAPDLLDAIEKARLVLDSWLSSNNDPAWINELVTVTKGALTIGNAAIAKARGEVPS